MNVMCYLLARLVPKQDNRWVVGAWFGQKYNDNSKYFFEYVIQNHPEIDIVWISRNEKVLQLVKAKGHRGYHTHDLRAVWYCLTAGVAIFCQSKTTDLIASCVGPKTKLVQLWHGLGMKKVEPLPEGRSKFEFRNEQWTDYDIIITPSEFGKEKIIDLFSVKKETVFVTGYPRHDVLLSSKKPELTPMGEEIRKKRAEGFKIGLFTPTHRKAGLESVTDIFLPTIQILDTYCRQKNILIYTKLHHCHEKELQTLSKLTNIKPIADELIHQDIYTILPLADFLITDYSSLFTDFMLLNRPIIFTQFDKIRYEREQQGFYGDYDNLTPGRVTFNWIETVQALDNLKLSDNYDKIKKTLLAFSDTSNAKRVYEIINKQLH